MLQALLALALVIAFMPMLVRKMARSGFDAEMNAAMQQVNSAVPAVRAFGRDNYDSLQFGVQIYEGRDFQDALEPYGLPIGFVPRTPLGQNIVMITTRNDSETIAWLRIMGGRATGIEKAELALRIGFWAADVDGNRLSGATGGWDKDMTEFGYRPASGAIYVRVPLSHEFSDLLSTTARNIEANRMHVNLNMGGRDVRAARDITAREGNFRSVLSGDFILSGAEDGRRQRNRFSELNIRRAHFQSRDGSNALNISRGTMNARSVVAPTVSRYGDPGNLTSESVSVHNFAMAAGRTGFMGPTVWEVRGDAILSNVTLNTERVEVGGYINATRGQDVFVDEDELTFNQKSGIETNIVSATALTLRDQTSNVLLEGGSGPVIIDIRPAGVSVLPDVLLAGINNDGIAALASPSDESDIMTACRGIIGGLPGVNARYEQNSLAQNIICRFVFWQRLEQRIDKMQCILDRGEENC